VTAGTGFPEGFAWGAATSAFQIEGSPLADGAGESNWYRFTHEPGRVEDGTSADVSCDHYHRWAEDVELLGWLGANAYRFSIAWTRVQPSGTGKPNPAGLAFYSRLVDALLERGIRPCITLHHWDLPAPLADRGGWESADLPAIFADYARVVFGHLGDRVDWWSTLNEPWVIAHAGWVGGAHPPARIEPAKYPLVSCRLLRANAEAIRALRAEGSGRIGIVVNIEPKYPRSHAPGDLAATARVDAAMNRLFLDGAVRGEVPSELRELPEWAGLPASETEDLGEPMDFVGVNYYTRAVVAADAEGWLGSAPVPVDGAPHTDMGWEVHPESLTRVLADVSDTYGLPVYVTENGAAYPDPPRAAGRPHPDPARVSYLRAHLEAVERAIAAGADVRGYFAWSLLDNFEWGLGLSKRFGLVHVDFETGERTPKASAHFYRSVVRAHRGLGEE
jgi:beta-glucosidase